jgi:hypothetical protein
MKKITTNRLETAIDYEAIIDGFDPAKWREATPEEIAEHRERAKDAVIVEIEEINATDTAKIEEIDKSEKR